jgi:hypothetical protein
MRGVTSGYRCTCIHASLLIATTRNYEKEKTYRHISLYCASQILRFFFLQIKGLWQPCVEQVYGRKFSNSMCSVRVSVSHFGNSRNILNFFIIIIIIDLLSVIFDVTIVIVLGCHEPRPYKTARIRTVCFLTASPTGRSSVSLLLLGPPYSPRHNNIEIRLINKPTMAS